MAVVALKDYNFPHAALRAGIYLPHACCHGSCATCKIQVADGEVEHGETSIFALMDFEREKGKRSACRARLDLDVTIEACISTLMQRHLLERDIYMAKFFFAADASAANEKPAVQDHLSSTGGWA